MSSYRTATRQTEDFSSTPLAPGAAGRVSRGSLTSTSSSARKSVVPDLTRRDRLRPPATSSRSTTTPATQTIRARPAAPYGLGGHTYLPHAPSKLPARSSSSPSPASRASRAVADVVLPSTHSSRTSSTRAAPIARARSPARSPTISSIERPAGWPVERAHAVVRPSREPASSVAPSLRARPAATYGVRGQSYVHRVASFRAPVADPLDLVARASTDSDASRARSPRVAPIAQSRFQARSPFPRTTTASASPSVRQRAAATSRLGGDWSVPHAIPDHHSGSFGHSDPTVRASIDAHAQHTRSPHASSTRCRSPTRSSSRTRLATACTPTSSSTPSVLSIAATAFAHPSSDTHSYRALATVSMRPSASGEERDGSLAMTSSSPARESVAFRPVSALASATALSHRPRAVTRTPIADAPRSPPPRANLPFAMPIAHQQLPAAKPSLIADAVSSNPVAPRPLLRASAPLGQPCSTAHPVLEPARLVAVRTRSVATSGLGGARCDPYTIRAPAACSPKLSGLSEIVGYSVSTSVPQVRQAVLARSPLENEPSPDPSIVAATCAHPRLAVRSHRTPAVVSARVSPPLVVHRSSSVMAALSPVRRFASQNPVSTPVPSSPAIDSYSPHASSPSRSPSPHAARITATPLVRARQEARLSTTSSSASRSITESATSVVMGDVAPIRSTSRRAIDLPARSLASACASPPPQFSPRRDPATTCSNAARECPSTGPPAPSAMQSRASPPPVTLRDIANVDVRLSALFEPSKASTSSPVHVVHSVPSESARGAAMSKVEPTVAHISQSCIVPRVPSGFDPLSSQTLRPGRRSRDGSDVLDDACDLSKTVVAPGAPVLASIVVRNFSTSASDADRELETDAFRAVSDAMKRWLRAPANARCARGARVTLDHMERIMTALLSQTETQPVASTSSDETKREQLEALRRLANTFYLDVTKTATQFAAQSSPARPSAALRPACVSFDLAPVPSRSTRGTDASLNAVEPSSCQSMASENAIQRTDLSERVRSENVSALPCTVRARPRFDLATSSADGAVRSSAPFEPSTGQDVAREHTLRVAPEQVLTSTARNQPALSTSSTCIGSTIKSLAVGEPSRTPTSSSVHGVHSRASAGAHIAAMSIDTTATSSLCTASRMSSPSDRQHSPTSRPGRRFRDDSTVLDVARTLSETDVAPGAHVRPSVLLLNSADSTSGVASQLPADTIQAVQRDGLPLSTPAVASLARKDALRDARQFEPQSVLSVADATLAVAHISSLSERSSASQTPHTTESDAPAAVPAMPTVLDDVPPVCPTSALRCQLTLQTSSIYPASTLRQLSLGAGGSAMGVVDGVVDATSTSTLCAVYRMSSASDPPHPQTLRPGCRFGDESNAWNVARAPPKTVAAPGAPVLASLVAVNSTSTTSEADIDLETDAFRAVNDALRRWLRAPAKTRRAPGARVTLDRMEGILAVFRLQTQTAPLTRSAERKREKLETLRRLANTVYLDITQTAIQVAAHMRPPPVHKQLAPVPHRASNGFNAGLGLIPQFPGLPAVPETSDFVSREVDYGRGSATAPWNLSTPNAAETLFNASRTSSPTTSRAPEIPTLIVRLSASAVALPVRTNSAAVAVIAGHSGIYSSTVSVHGQTRSTFIAPAASRSPLAPESNGPAAVPAMPTVLGDITPVYSPSALRPRMSRMRLASTVRPLSLGEPSKTSTSSSVHAVHCGPNDVGATMSAITATTAHTSQPCNVPLARLIFDSLSSQTLRPGRRLGDDSDSNVLEVARTLSQTAVAPNAHVLRSNVVSNSTSSSASEIDSQLHVNANHTAINTAPTVPGDAFASPAQALPSEVHRYYAPAAPTAACSGAAQTQGLQSTQQPARSTRAPDLSVDSATASPRALPISHMRAAPSEPNPALSNSAVTLELDSRMSDSDSWFLSTRTTASIASVLSSVKLGQYRMLSPGDASEYAGARMQPILHANLLDHAAKPDVEHYASGPASVPTSNDSRSDGLRSSLGSQDAASLKPPLQALEDGLCTRERMEEVTLDSWMTSCLLACTCDVAMYSHSGVPVGAPVAATDDCRLCPAEGRDALAPGAARATGRSAPTAIPAMTTVPGDDTHFRFTSTRAADQLAPSVAREDAVGGVAQSGLWSPGDASGSSQSSTVVAYETFAAAPARSTVLDTSLRLSSASAGFAPASKFPRSFFAPARWRSPGDTLECSNLRPSPASYTNRVKDTARPESGPYTRTMLTADVPLLQKYSVGPIPFISSPGDECADIACKNALVRDETTVQQNTKTAWFKTDVAPGAQVLASIVVLNYTGGETTAQGIRRLGRTLRTRCARDVVSHVHRDIASTAPARPSTAPAVKNRKDVLRVAGLFGQRTVDSTMNVADTKLAVACKAGLLSASQTPPLAVRCDSTATLTTCPLPDSAMVSACEQPSAQLRAPSELSRTTYPIEVHAAHSGRGVQYSSSAVYNGTLSPGDPPETSSLRAASSYTTPNAQESLPAPPTALSARMNSAIVVHSSTLPRTSSPRITRYNAVDGVPARPPLDPATSNAFLAFTFWLLATFKPSMMPQSSGVRAALPEPSLQPSSRPARLGRSVMLERERLFILRALVVTVLSDVVEVTIQRTSLVPTSAKWIPAHESHE